VIISIHIENDGVTNPHPLQPEPTLGRCRFAMTSLATALRLGACIPLLRLAVAEPALRVIAKAFFTDDANQTAINPSNSRTILGSHGGTLWTADNLSCGARFTSMLRQ
jgi:hypothetical protein